MEMTDVRGACSLQERWDLDCTGLLHSLSVVIPSQIIERPSNLVPSSPHTARALLQRPSSDVLVGYR